MHRVGIARALSMEGLLLDEPLGALDALPRAKLQGELLTLLQKTQSTVVMVTHDVDEAVLLRDRIVMLTNGPSATIGDIVTLALERPLNRIKLAESTHYLGYRKAVIDFFTPVRHTWKS